MGQPIELGGTLWYRTEEHAREALAAMQAHDSAVLSGAARVRFRMLEVEAVGSCPAGTFDEAMATLRRIAADAVAGTVYGSWGEYVAQASGRFGARAPDLSLRTGSSLWAEQRRSIAPVPDYRFELDDCAVLVVYALAEPDAEPGGDTPSFVVGRVDADLGSDIAPYISETDLDGLLREAADGLLDAEDSSPETTALVELYDWACAAGTDCFAYQLEPPAIAGDGTARSRGLEAETR